MLTEKEKIENRCQTRRDDSKRLVPTFNDKVNYELFVHIDV